MSEERIDMEVEEEDVEVELPVPNNGDPIVEPPHRRISWGGNCPPIGISAI